MFDDFLGGQIEHFAQGIATGEAWFVFCDFSELAIQPLDDIGCIYDSPKLGRVCEKGGE